jgi:hypothetical protein
MARSIWHRTTPSTPEGASHFLCARLAGADQLVVPEAGGELVVF